MPSDTAASAIRIAWITFALFWIASSRRVKTTERLERRGSLIARAVALAAALLVAFVRWGALSDTLLPRTPTLFAASAVITWAGVLFAIWARVIIGRNWSSSVTLKHSHDLVQSGPYRLVRHPIYSGMLLSFAGGVLFLDRVGSLIALLMTFAIYYWKAHQEEKLLADHFGDNWRRYRKSTRAIIPFIL